MSTYRATLIFNDNQQLNVDMNEADLESFSENISNYKIFWNKEQTQGFWTDIKNVRYISFNKQEKVIDGSKPEKNKQVAKRSARQTTRAKKHKTGNAA